jgi:predicted RNA-binding protein with PIN domain
MLYLIDGYNLLFSGAGRRPRDARDLEAGRDELLRLLECLHAARGGRSILVFDSREPGLFGLPRRRREGPVEIRFAPADRRADDLLKDLIAETKDAQGTTVVTSDREILDAAAARGMRTAGAKAFWDTLTGPAKGRDAGTPEPPGKHRGIPASEVDYWMKEFGVMGGEGDTSPQ